MAEIPDYYSILEVSPLAEQETIDAAFKRLARKYHPDTSKSPNATKRMQEINEAYEVLKNPKKRKIYDRSRKFSSAKEHMGEEAAYRRAEEERRRKHEAEAARRKENIIGLIIIFLLMTLFNIVGNISSPNYASEMDNDANNYPPPIIEIVEFLTPTYTVISTRASTRIIPTNTPISSDSTFIVNNWQIRVDKVEILEEIRFLDEKINPSGRFLALFLSVTNLGTETKSFIGTFGYVDVINSNFHVYEEDIPNSITAADMWEFPYNGLDIKPQETRPILVVYDIPNDSFKYYLFPGILAENDFGEIALDLP